MTMTSLFFFEVYKTKTLLTNNFRSAPAIQYFFRALKPGKSYAKKITNPYHLIMQKTFSLIPGFYFFVYLLNCILFTINPTI